MEGAGKMYWCISAPPPRKALWYPQAGTLEMAEGQVSNRLVITVATLQHYQGDQARDINF